MQFSENITDWFLNVLFIYNFFSCQVKNIYFKETIRFFTTFLFACIFLFRDKKMANLSLLPNSTQEKLKENVALPVRKDENYYSQDQWPHPFTCKCSQSSRIPAFCLCSRIHIQSATLSHSSRETLALRGLNFLRDVIMRIFNSEGGKM